ncbi:TadE/TadG family type IV pilus assembly protein [Mesorhizobium sp. YR577]|jgi:Flp pilus assembly protein TadG|uniref:TadE/TadG family type IV pilus assembly protein n=1 Tax=Mesorhizobium sp. YR577 TaxID=1884373 RepID=UPI0008EC63FB|nr:TadE/TadG family type IV pilus assembly protein [Mesorhizobium sp. YR577]SFT40911.1 Flp pilus assembly protein TadG [Mesorhizobium sp. YR577]
MRRARALSDFAKNRSGNFTLMAAVSMSVLLLTIGFGINVAQSLNVKSSLQSALDSAVTSTARDLTTGAIKEKDARATVEAFLVANSTSRFSTKDRFVLDNLVVDQTARTITATAHANVVLAFPLFGMGDPRVGSESAAVYSDRKIEVAMMLDVTGSMEKDKNGDKIGDLKTAAKNAVDAFLKGQDATKPRVRVAIVPYANSVNAGALAAKSVFVETNSTSRSFVGGTADAKPVSGSGGNSSSPSGGGGSKDNCATERPGPYQYTDAGPGTSMVHRDYLLNDYAEYYNTNKCPDAEIMPLTADATALKKRIDEFKALGGTGGHIGVQWTWYMLSEKWGDVVGEAARPAKLEPKKVAKYAILMTDGEFNLSYFDVTDYKAAYAAAGKQATRDAAKKLCKAMRDGGIEVFSIGFQLVETNAKATMKDCASPDTNSVKHYYETSTGAQLNSAFQEIAGNIEALALTK